MEEITFNENGPAAVRSTCVSRSRDARDLWEKTAWSVDALSTRGPGA